MSFYRRPGNCENHQTWNLLIDSLLKAEPGHVPASIALRVTAHSHLRVRHDVPTEWIISCQSPQLSEELIAADVVAPCLCHWTLDCHSITLITCCCYPLGSHEFCEGVDTVGLE